MNMDHLIVIREEVSSCIDLPPEKESSYNVRLEAEQKERSHRK